MAYRDMGYFPEAVVNYLVRLAWSHGDQEIFSREELIEKFTLENVGNIGGSVQSGKIPLGELSVSENRSHSTQLADEIVPFIRDQRLSQYRRTDRGSQK